MILCILFTCLRWVLPTSLRRRIYLFFDRIGVKMYGPTDFSVQRLPGNLFLERSIAAIQEVEAIAMRIVAAHTTIPIPKVIDLLDNEYILMTGLPCDTLGPAFYRMDERQVEHERKSLQRTWMMQQLQSIPQHPGANGVICGPLPTMPCCDINQVEEDAFGPFPDLASFHEFLPGHGQPKESTEEREKMLHVHSKPQRIVYTHGDLTLEEYPMRERSRDYLDHRLDLCRVVPCILGARKSCVCALELPGVEGDVSRDMARV